VTNAPARSASEGWPAEIPILVASALDSLRGGSIVFETGLRVAWASETLASVLGVKRDELARGTDLISIIRLSAAMDTDSRVLLESRLFEAVERPESETAPIKLFSVDRSRALIAEIRSIGEQCWIATFEDITDRNEAESRLLTLASKDPLTGLGNRALFEKSLRSALTGSPEPGSTIFILDLDRFKAVNDTLGHPTGDGVLRLVAQRLQSAVRESDIIGRLGGDEFAILFGRHFRPADAVTLAGRIIDLLQRPYMVGGQVANIGASIGIAVAPRDGVTAERLIKCADLALYESKASGRSRFHFYDPGMEDRAPDHPAQDRRALELELRKALPLRQMEVHYKPQVDITSKTLLRFEAAVRWRHPTRGLLEATEFAAVCTALRPAVRVSEWALRTACQDAARWPGEIGVSVRIAPYSFEKGRLLDAVSCALTHSSLAANRLEVAITEDVLFLNESGNENGVLEMLHGLRALGVRVAVDCSGSGWTSFRQFASFPFDRVNIDGSLLSGSAGNYEDRALVKAIAALGASLGMPTTADGIQTCAELAKIRSEGGGGIEGYLPAKWVGSSELPNLIADLKGET